MRHTKKWEKEANRDQSKDAQLSSQSGDKTRARAHEEEQSGEESPAAGGIQVMAISSLGENSGRKGRPDQLYQFTKKLWSGFA